MRLPFIRAALIILAITLTILAIGILFFFSLTTPILTKLAHAYVRLRAIIDHSPALIFITDSSGQKVYTSPSAKALTKIPNTSGEETIKHKDGSAHTLNYQISLVSREQRIWLLPDINRYY